MTTEAIRRGADGVDIVSMIIQAYVENLGIEKWNSLTAEQQHDVIIIIVKDIDSRI